MVVLLGVDGVSDNGVAGPFIPFPDRWYAAC
jgi:hypothetical protein